MQNRKFKIILLLALITVWIGAADAPAFAAVAVPDPDQSGGITVTMQDPDTKQPVAGGTFTLYRAGEIQADDGNYSFALAEDFSDSGLSLVDPESAELAAGLAGYAREHRLTGASVTVGQDGTASFAGLQPGLYLLVQDQPAEGYDAVNPFLVSVPVREGEDYVYTVDATPKMGPLVKAPEETKPVETKPAETKPAETQPVTPEPAPTPTLPHTGQLNWPIPVMAAAGLLLFAIGWVLYMTRERKKDHAC